MDQKETEVVDTLDKESPVNKTEVYLRYVSSGLTTGSALALSHATSQELSTWRRHIPGFLKTEALIRTESSKRCRLEAEQYLAASSPKVAEKVVNLALECDDPKVNLAAAAHVLKGAGIGGFTPSGGALIQADGVQVVNILSSIAFERGSKPRPEDS